MRLNRRQRLAIWACLLLLLLFILVPPYEQINTYLDESSGESWVDSDWLGYSFLWAPPDRPGRRGGPVQVDKEMICVQIICVLSLLTLFLVKLKGYPAGKCSHCGYDLRGNVAANSLQCPECGDVITVGSKNSDDVE